MSEKSQKISNKPYKNPMQGMNPHLYDMITALMMMGRQKAMRRMEIDLAEIQLGSQILEVGCGTGSLTLLVKKQAGENGSVHGTDPLPQMIELAKKKAEKAKLMIDFQLGSIEQIPFPDDSFDEVLASFMIFHTNDATRQDGLNEIFRVLKPGGTFLIVDTKPLQKKKVQKVAVGLTGPVMWENPLEKLQPMLETAGFQLIQVGDTKYAIIGFVKAKK